MKRKSVNQEDIKYLPGSPVATDYVPLPAGGRTHITVKGSKAGIAPIILANLGYVY